MTVLELMGVILKASKNNFELLFEDKKLEKYIDDAIMFIQKDKAFRNLISSNDPSDIEKLSKLSKDLSALKNDFEYFCKLNQKKFEGPVDAISFLILKYKAKFFGNELNLYDINQTLETEFFIPNFNYLTFVRNLDAKIDTVLKEENKIEITDSKRINIILKAMSVLSKVYEKNGMEAVKKVCGMNDACLEIYEQYQYKQNARKTDLFDMIYGYNYLSQVTMLDGEDKNIKAFEELTSPNGVFKNLTEHEIVELIYNYFVLYKTGYKIVSETADFAFKDLSPVAGIIKRRVRDGAHSSNIIEALASGKISITFNEQSSKKMGNL